MKVPCTRPSTLAKALSDSSGLIPFHAATTLQVLAGDVDLRNRLALIEGDDWRAFKPVHEEAQRRRGKPEAEAGTNIHMAVSAMLTGRDVVGLDGATLQDAQTVLDALGASGLEPVESEVFVVALDALPEPVAGTRDLLCRDVASGELVVVDIKSSSNPGSVRWRWQEWAIQIVCYAHGERYHLDGDQVPRDRWQRPLIDPGLIQPALEPVSKHVGYVVDVVRGGDRVTVSRLDLDLGLRAATLACHVRAMRKASGGALDVAEYVTTG